MAKTGFAESESRPWEALGMRVCVGALVRRAAWSNEVGPEGFRQVGAVKARCRLRWAAANSAWLGQPEAMAK